MTRSRSKSVVAFGALVALVGCAAGQSEPGSPFDGTRGSEDILLTVENNDFADATIHLYWNGVRQRAGFVTGKTTETFRLPWKSEWAYIEVDFVGGTRDYQSERVSIYPGDHLNFVIMVGLSGN